MAERYKIELWNPRVRGDQSKFDKTFSKSFNERFWSKSARTYDDDTEYVVGKFLCQAILRKLSEECNLGKVIEFGCGSGYYTKAISRNAKHITATDLSDEMLEMAKIKLGEFQNITIEKADCEDTCFPSESFDTVFIANTINTVENPTKVLKESYRVLGRDGLLLIVNYTIYDMKWTETTRHIIRFLRKYGIPPAYIRNYSPERLTRLIQNAGFNVSGTLIIGDKTKAIYLKARKD